MIRWPHKLLAVLLGGLTCFAAAATEEGDEPLPDMSAYEDFEGISPREIGNFWEKWQLVTVRFRKDVEEQRFVYANPIAWKAMREGKKKYPVGSMFGKVAFKSKVDPAFPVSVLPSGLARIQIMKRDPAYAKTGGWGYAIYPENRRGHQSNENVISACFACHVAVAKKDYVFSEMAFPPQGLVKAASATLSFRNQFKATTLARLSKYQAKVFSGQVPGATHLKILEMPMFAGSVSESVATLAEYTVTDKIPYLLIDDRSQQYLLAFARPPSKECATSAQLIMMMEAVAQKGQPPPPPQQRVQRISTACNGKITNLIDAPVRSQ